MADSPIYLLNPLGALVGTERIPADKSPFGVVGSTGYLTPASLLAFLNSNSSLINGNLTPGFLPVAAANFSTSHTLENSRVYQNTTDTFVRSLDNNSVLTVGNGLILLSFTDSNDNTNNNFIQQDFSKLLLYWTSASATAQVSLGQSALALSHSNLISLTAPRIALTGGLTTNRILYLDGSNQLASTTITPAQINALAPVTTVFTTSWSTQTLDDVATLYYFVNASNSTAKTINLPANPTNFNYVVIKDKKGDAATNNITISGNGKLIDGVSSILINGNNQAYTLKYDGNAWNLI